MKQLHIRVGMHSCVFMSVCLYIYMYVCMYVYVCMHVCMCICMYMLLTVCIIYVCNVCIMCMHASMYFCLCVRCMNRLWRVATSFAFYWSSFSLNMSTCSSQACLHHTWCEASMSNGWSLHIYPLHVFFVILQIMHTLLLKECSRKRGGMAQSCLHAYLKKMNFTLTECIAQDNR